MEAPANLDLASLPGTHASRSAQGPIPALTSIRGLAAWWVVIYHFQSSLNLRGITGTLIGHGYAAVDLFFVLSGFVIGFNYLSRFHAPTWRGFVQFLGLRFARIYPLHLFMLLVFLVNPLALALSGRLPIDAVRYSPLYYLYSLFLIQNWGLTHSLAWNVPAWSISTEWMAYLLFPAFAWLVIRTARSPARAVLMVLVSLIVLGAVLAAMGEDLGGDIPATGLIRCLLEFLSGMYIYLVSMMTCDRRLPAEAATLAGVVLVAFYFVLPLPDYVLLPSAWSCLIYGLSIRDSFASRLLSAPILVAIGEYSYSTYMAHYFVRDWVKFLLMRNDHATTLALIAYLAVTAAASVLLYRVIEVPSRRWLRAVMNGI